MTGAGNIDAGSAVLGPFQRERERERERGITRGGSSTIYTTNTYSFLLCLLHTRTEILMEGKMSKKKKKKTTLNQGRK